MKCNFAQVVFAQCLASIIFWQIRTKLKISKQLFNGKVRKTTEICIITNFNYELILLAPCKYIAQAQKTPASFRMFLQHFPLFFCFPVFKVTLVFFFVVVFFFFHFQTFCLFFPCILVLFKNGDAVIIILQIISTGVLAAPPVVIFDRLFSRWKLKEWILREQIPDLILFMPSTYLHIFWQIRDICCKVRKMCRWVLGFRYLRF